MTARFATFNSTWGYGLYLSKPGFDATTNPDPENFLLHSNVKQEQVLSAGYVQVPVGSVSGATFPQVLPSPPLFWMNFSTEPHGTQAMPFDVGIVNFGPSPQTQYAVTAEVTASSVQFINHIQNLAANLQFIAMARGG